MGKTNFFNRYLLPELEKTFTSLKFTWTSVDNAPAHSFLGHAEAVSTPANGSIQFEIKISVSYLGGTNVMNVGRRWWIFNSPSEKVPNPLPLLKA